MDVAMGDVVVEVYLAPTPLVDMAAVHAVSVAN